MRQEALTALAERALEGARGEAQATVWWERQLSSRAGGVVTTEAVSLEVAVVRDGRVGTAVTTDLEAPVLELAARAAAAGPEAVGPLAEPSAGREHEGYDATAVLGEPVVVGEWSSWRAAAARTAIASTKGVRAYEERSFGELRVRRHAGPGRSLELSTTAVSPRELDETALGAEARVLLGPEGPPAPVEPGEYAVVLGPWAVAEVLRRAALAFGGPRAPVADRLGSRVAAPAVTLSEAPRFAATLPRNYDAEGAPRQALPLIQDGVAHRVVGPGTGHAVVPAGAQLPEHLVLTGGGEPGLEDLAAPIDRGLLIPSLSLHGAWVLGRRGAAMAEGVRAIRGGEPAEPVANLTVLFEPLELLGAVQALTTRQRTVPSPLLRSARTASATVAPGVRARLVVAGAA